MLFRSSIDTIVTDPPYFDRVHYDDLAGAFNTWFLWCNVARKSQGSGIQSEDATLFSHALHEALKTSVSALKDRGKLIFSFHHDDITAWLALAAALEPLTLMGDNMILVPAEMPNALVKQRARLPIAFDALLCFFKAKRSMGDHNRIEAAVRLALRALAGTKNTLPGDVVSAAYAAGVVVGLKNSTPPKDWEGFLDSVRQRVEEVRH